MTKAKKIFLWAVPFALSLAFQLYVVNMTAGEGEELAKIEGKIEIARRQNQVLEEEITQYSSLARIDAEASKLNLVKPKDIIYAKNKGTAQVNATILGQ